jgi:hypothetical protein
MNAETQRLNQSIESLLESWISRDTDGCRFCNETADGDPPAEQFRDDESRERFMAARASSASCSLHAPISMGSSLHTSRSRSPSNVSSSRFRLRPPFRLVGYRLRVRRQEKLAIQIAYPSTGELIRVMERERTPRASRSLGPGFFEEFEIDAVTGPEFSYVPIDEVEQFSPTSYFPPEVAVPTPVPVRGHVVGNDRRLQKTDCYRSDND